MKNRTGLVSVSFRALSCEEIIEITASAGLDGIEWGSDVHVPPKDPGHAKNVAGATRAAGLAVTSYGSYYRAGAYGENYRAEFAALLDTALILGAPVIRVWAGETGSRDTPDEKRARLVAETQEIADMAAEKKIRVAFECHNGTLTDEYHSSVRLMREIGRANVRMYWQPDERRDFSYNLEALEAILPYLETVHVFHWPEPGVRLPLADGAEVWPKYFETIAAADKTPAYLLEFMPDDDPASLPREARTLRRFLSGAVR